MSFKVGVVIASAGIGERLGKIDKAVLKLNNFPLFYYSFKVFEGIRNIEQIVLVLRRKNFKLAKTIINDSRLCLVEGGKERKDSVYNGLKALREDISYVIIHDGARPFLKRKLVLKVLKGLKKYSAVICAVSSKDTVKLGKKGFVIKTLNRDNIFLVQTPQGFKRELILEAYSKFYNKDIFDDAQLIENFSKKVKIIEGDPLNIKITYPQDIILAKAILKEYEF
ncbi:MAG: 2-C-methyl-D-erythritol 4-phosphate cytidylyltransferase [Candidatus Aenigmatarchaeota archaeon]